MATKISWFGGHMARTVRELKERLRLVDLVLEVRDARIPFSSSNPELSKLVQHKQRLVILNKADLAASDQQQAVKHALQQQGLHAIFTSSQKAGSIRQLLQQATSMLRDAKPNADVLMIMAVGVPNSGKSSLINALRHAAKVKKEGSSGKAATGPTAGLTRHISGFQVGERPTTFIMDTPGVMLPHVPDEQTGMRLALTGAIKDSIVAEEALVRHMLWELANQPQFAVPSQEANRKKDQPKRASLPAAVEAAVTAMKKLHCSAHAEYPVLQHAASSSAAQAALGNIMRTTAVSDESRSQLKHSAAADTERSNASQDTSANAAVTGSGEAKDTSGTTSAEALKSLSIETGLDLLHHTLKLDKLDVDRLSSTHRKVVDAYRTGKLGRYTLDAV